MNNSVKCFIIDDEPSARDILRKFISKISFLSIAGEFENAVDALFQIRQYSPDVIFLDVEMPELNGLEFVKSINSNSRPRIIMVSAYTKYAIDGFEYEAIDYLHKPFSFDRFTRSVHKLLEQIPHFNILSGEAKEVENLGSSALKNNSTDENILIKVDKRLIRVQKKDILTVESLGDYIKVSIEQKSLITHMTMNNIESLLIGDRFIRISRFQIINKFIIDEIEGNQITARDGSKFLIGVSYRDKVLLQLQSNW